MISEAYGELLTSTQPSVIKTKKEYFRVEKIFNTLFDKDRTPDEDRLFDLLATLMESYENETLPPIELTSPIEILKYFMKDRNLKQKDLVSVFKTESVVSEVLNGKRSISMEYAKSLAEFFMVSPSVFLEM